MTKKFNAPRTLALALLMLSPLTTGCALMRKPTPLTGIAFQPVAPAPVPDCVNWRGLSYSPEHDTPQTVREIIANNERRRAACGA